MDKYYYYRNSVQCPEDEVTFFLNTYREFRGRDPQVMGEDFSGAFAVSCEWVKGAPDRRAVAVDLDGEPLQYGKEHYLSELPKDAQVRVQVLCENVMSPNLPKADFVAAMNFSYFIFKSRDDLRSYFKNVYNRLENEGLFFVDCFGGSEQQVANEEETEFDDFSFFWDQVSFDPISCRAVFHIHFQLKGQPKKEKVFTYDWRMWSISEIREVMTEAGFKESHVYWEGADENGDGNNVFTRTEVGDECEGWVAYIVGVK